MFKFAKLRQYFGTNKKSSPTKWYTKRLKSAENQPYIPNVNRFVYISPCLNSISNSFQGLSVGSAHIYHLKQWQVFYNCYAKKQGGGMQRESTSPHLLYPRINNR